MEHIIVHCIDRYIEHYTYRECFFLFFQSISTVNFQKENYYRNCTLGNKNGNVNDEVYQVRTYIETYRTQSAAN